MNKKLLIGTAVLLLAVAIGIVTAMPQPNQPKEQTSEQASEPLVEEVAPQAPIEDEPAVAPQPVAAPAPAPSPPPNPSDENKARVTREIRAAFPSELKDVTNPDLQVLCADRRITETTGYGNYDTAIKDEIISLYFYGRKNENGETVKAYWHNGCGLRYYVVPS